MANDIQVGIRIDNTGAIKSIDLLDNSIVDLTDSTETLNKELVDTISATIILQSYMQSKSITLKNSL